MPDTADKVEWFYSEITVPKSNDVIGSYFMANGFAEGYFGIQVNSASERRVLFSVWSPYSSTYLTKLHSFLENFEPWKGNITRKAFYHNQWIKTSKGEWKPLTKAIFTGDATARKDYRLDYSGGAENGKFFLRNCGFFNDSTKLNTVFEIGSVGEKPVIDFDKLK